MERSKAEKDIENFVFGSSGWNLISRGDFLFAAYSNYVLRYDIKKNQIDKFIYLGDSSDYPLGVSVSSDGRYLISYNFDFDNEKSSFNYFLTDITDETTELISAEYNDSETESIQENLDLPDEIKAELKDLRFDVPEKSGEDVDWAKITVIEKPTEGWTVIDDNILGIIMPTVSENQLKLGYYKIVVIDYNKDKIINECPLLNK